MINTPQHLRAGARRIRELGVKPELEIFDTGNLWFAKQMLAEGLIDEPPLFQLCMGIPWGVPADAGVMKAMVDLLPAGANWTGFGIGRMQMPMAAQAVLLGGHVRVGLEDNLYLERGVLASNAQLVEKAVRIVEALGARVLGPPRRAPGSVSRPRAERAAVRPEPAEVQRIACVGAGVIGGGWAAHFWRAAMRSWPGTRRRTPKRGCASWSRPPGRRSQRSASPPTPRPTG